MNFLDLSHLRQRVCEAGGMGEGPESMYAVAGNHLPLNKTKETSALLLLLFLGLRSLGVYFLQK